MLRLVVVSCLNAHKRHVRDPPPFPITLLGYDLHAHSFKNLLEVTACCVGS